MSEARLLRLIEIVSVIVIVGTALAMSVPKYREVQRSGVAAALLLDVEVVRNAVYRFYSDSAYFPGQTGREPVPAGLVRYLPRGFSFRKDYGVMEYVNWPIPVRDSTAPAPNVIGLRVTVTDPRVGAAAEARAHEAARFAVGNRYTFLFFGS